jgi:Mrp family chromosome partitioning ATPase
MFSKSKKRKSKTTNKKAYTPLISSKNPNPFLLEAYRTLLTNLRFYQPTKLLKTLVVTSTGPQEGKSSTVSNLGILMAQGGSKVLLVDADLRSPSLSKIFHIPNSSGLTDLLIQISSAQITQGRLNDFSVGDVYQLIKIQKKTGILTVEEEDKSATLYFEEGNVIEANWENVPQTKGFREIFRFKEGSFHFEETVSINDHVDVEDIPNLPATRDTIRNTIPQVYRHPFIDSRIHSFLKPTHIENLTLLTSGHLPPNPPLLLGSESMKSLLGILRNSFDAVIFDSPPAGILTDTSILTSLVDGVVLVVKKGSYNKKFVKKVKERLEKGNANICGVVLNQADLKNDEYYDYGSYGYGKSP